jgi:glycosyltransferase involved in cell wall biosynthesis
MLQVSHFVGLSGVGGVQRNFVEYINHQATSEYRLKHKVYTLGKVDLQYQLHVDIYDIRKLKNLFSLILDIVSRHRIVHLYNNLTSLKVAVLLFFLPVYNVILHERGAIWNLKFSHGALLRFIAWKSELILANSNATKIMLEKKFYIPSEKIKVLHNGINIEIKCTKKESIKDHYPIFRIGFIGRLDTPKGVHVLIDAMSQLVDSNIELKIAGSGILEKSLKRRANGLRNISFIGRLAEPYGFLSDLDLLVVPSIREPLGNVCLEAGLCRVPVLAANVDGIPEIIENGVSGELIESTVEVLIEPVNGAVPLPEFVINPTVRKLCTPKQIDPSLLAKKILELSTEHNKLECYSDKLYDKVVTYFNMGRYEKELYMIYNGFNI